jgi:hypothetical protein
VFDADTLSRLRGLAPPEVMNIPVHFDEFLPDDRIAVTRIYTYANGHKGIEIRVNSRLAIDPETLAYVMAHEAGHCKDVLLGRPHNPLNLADVSKAPGELRANEFAARAVGFKDPGRRVLPLREMPEGAVVSTGDDIPTFAGSYAPYAR